jgi:hypothetical protein
MILVSMLAVEAILTLRPTAEAAPSRPEQGGKDPLIKGLRIELAHECQALDVARGGRG